MRGRGMRGMRAWLLAAALLAALAGGARAQCNYSLALPAGSAPALNASLPATGWCAPFSATSSVPTYTCGGVSVPAGGMLAFGTCALPGAACTGATNLILKADVGGATLSTLTRVTGGSTVAKLSQGCVLGARCSYGEWRNTALAPAGVSIQEKCYGDSVCSGVVAWRVGGDATALTLSKVTLPKPTTIAFTLTAARAANLTALRGGAATGVLVSIYGRSGDGFANGAAALGNATGWTLLWGPAAWTGGAVTLDTALPLAAGAVSTLLVNASGANLTCAHSLGTFASLGTVASSTLLADTVLSVKQGGVMPAGAAFTPGNATTACAWKGLSLTYVVAGACAAAPPPPRPLIATSVPTTLVGSLDDLLRALNDSSVLNIEVGAHIALNGTQLGVALDPATQSRTLQILGTNACFNADPSRGELCILDAGGVSRVISFGENVTLTLGYLALANGVAPAGQSGGCVLAECAGCSLALRSATFTNCTATGSGGGVALHGGGSLTADGAVFTRNVGAHGAGLMVHGGTARVTGTRFVSNTAIAASSDAPIEPADLLGPSGGGLALEVTTGSVSSCVFEDNAAATTDFVLVANPDLPQARGGGLFMSSSVVAVSGCTFARNAAFYGGGVYAYNTTLTLSLSALARNIATLGDGGGLFASDCRAVSVTDSLVSGNAAGGHTGGGIAALNTPLTLLRSTLTENAASRGCGGSVGLDAAAWLILGGGTVISNSSARDGGGACCNLCLNATMANATFFANVATQGSGGAIFTGSTTTTVTNVTLFGNSAPTGGSISAVSSALTVTDCRLYNNTASATHGGAILHTAYDDSKQDLVLVNVALANNTCMSGGGAVAAFATRTAKFDNCRFDTNEINSQEPAGGAVLLLGVGRVFMYSCAFSYNKVRVLPAVVSEAGALLGFVSGVSASGTGLGGAVWIGTNTRCSANIVTSNFTRNGAPSGGAMYITGKVAITISESNFYHDHSSDWAGRGGAIVTDSTVVLDVIDSLFFSCEANMGGAGWHGGRSNVTYTNCIFEENEGVPGEDMKGTALQVTDSSRLVVAGSTFLNNMGTELAQGTVVLSGTNSSRLAITNTLFDGNFAFLGGCLFVTVFSQQQQLNLSGVTFRNSFAYVGSVLFTEAVDFAPLNCAPTPCDVAEGNFASNYGQVISTPPTQFLIDMPARIRSGAPLPINVTLQDGFNQQVMDWDNTVAIIDTRAQLSGSLRTFYTRGKATFVGLSMHGGESQSYDLLFTVTGPELFGNGVDSRSMSRAVEVEACEPGETFDDERLECACADGFGLVVADNTCRTCEANEVVPPGDLSCAICPALSVPISPSECQCVAGYFGTIVGATGVCTECAADSFRAADDSPVQCRACPATSHTFALGAKSEADCLCAANTFNDRRGSNGTFSCADVPEGGWAPQADSRLFALQGYWRPDASYTTFYPCTAGMCLREEPQENGTEQAGQRCRDGHGGHLCGVCDYNWAYQGIYCEQCKPLQRYDEWGPARRGGIWFIGLFLMAFFVFIIFFMPLFPRVEAIVQSVTAPAVEHLENMLSSMAAVARKSAGPIASRPQSAAQRPQSAAMKRVLPVPGRKSEDLPPPAGPLDNRLQSVASMRLNPRRSSHSQPIRRSSFTTAPAPGPASDDVGASSPLPHIRVQRPSRLMVFLDLIAEPLRIVITFWQIVSSFSTNLYVPWPSIYYALANSLSVVSLQFLKLPAISCVQPEVSFYTVFNGVTICTALYILFCLAVYYFGARTKVALADAARRRRFKSQVLNAFIWGLFLVYPQVSSTTLLIFACTKLEDGTSWLMADYRLQCWTPQHKVYVGAGAFWTLLLPFGIPAMFVYLLYKSKVPHLAAWKRDCAWLRAIVQRALVLGIDLETEMFDPDTLTVESISLKHLRALHSLFVQGGADADGGMGASAHGGGYGGRSFASGASGEPVSKGHTLADALRKHLPLLRAHTAERDADGEVVPHHAPGVGRAPVQPAAGVSDAAQRAAAEDAEDDADDSAEGMAMGRGSSKSGTRSANGSTKRLAGLRRSLKRAQSTLSDARSQRGSRLLAVFTQVRVQLAVTAAMKRTSLRRSLSTLFYKNEREQLIKQLLEWARHDKGTLVAEPRDNQLRWRTQYEWDALRAEDAKLGARDTAERAGYFKFRFLFASYSVHAWYWEAIDMFQKLFLTSLISFIAPHTAVQIIIATMFAFGMVLFTTRIKPYRERYNNQLVSLSQINLFLFLFTGLLLQTNPEGIKDNRLLFAVVVGMLTTSIVAFSFYLFLRELSRQLLNTLIDIQDEEDDDNASAAESDEEAGTFDIDSPHDHDALGLTRGVWDDASGEPNSPHISGVDDMMGEDGSAGAHGNEGTPPPPTWVARLASREAGGQ